MHPALHWNKTNDPEHGFISGLSGLLGDFDRFFLFSLSFQDFPGNYREVSEIGPFMDFPSSGNKKSADNRNSNVNSSKVTFLAVLVWNKCLIR